MVLRMGDGCKEKMVVEKEKPGLWGGLPKPCVGIIQLLEAAYSEKAL